MASISESNSTDAATQAAAVTPTPAAKSGAGKIILILVAVFVGLGVLGIGAAGYVAWRIHRAIAVNPATHAVTIHTKDADFSTQNTSLSAGDLGVALYPGAQQQSTSGRIAMAEGTIISGVFLTTDSKDQVAAFYKNALGAGTRFSDYGSAAQLTSGNLTKNRVAITISQRPASDHGLTKILIVHTTMKNGQ
jgi:hypothetical protein